MKSLSLGASLLVTIALVGAACATAESSDFGDTKGGAGGSSGEGGSAGAGGSAGTAGGTGGSGGGALIDGGSGGNGGQPSGPPIIYAHTNTTLSKLDPQTKQLTTVGDFDCIGGSGNDSSMTDLAVNKQLDLWGISSKKVYKLAVTGSTVHCAQTIPLNGAKGVSFYGLTFAPEGVLGAGEVLVAANTAGELWAIDAAGNLSQHGTFGTVPNDDGNGNAYPNAGSTWELSGDIVFVAGTGTPLGFATVRDCLNPPSTSGCSKIDTLIEIDVAKLSAVGSQNVTKSVRGQIVSGCNDGLTEYGGMYGIAAWNDKVYGFSHTGNLVTVNLTNGQGCLVQTFASDLWAGAGVTTLAPVEEPPPK